MQLSGFNSSKANSREKPCKLTDGGRLFLLAELNRSKFWQQKYRHLEIERLLSHGKYPDVTLDQARQKLHDARALLAEGKDPATKKKLDRIAAETQARTTFKLVAEEYLENSAERGLTASTMKKKRWFLLDLA
ncbi:Arm DNA-binding domain-containing protein [Profundibacter amoris]|uniref:DUF4102 domain-containing protein n=1 Tax=Profundibacter amoris TaxID=2171755 RepID=A0A347UD60_9RHOB|nr:Arm DNA-binding domain-containing protein [Profundibacter amoris]AXX96788.1 DUF4102 domain-containing protein [Profundibacter amoris]